MEKGIITAALVGAPNCGKSTLYNRLARASEPVGNRAGVTVDSASRRIKGKLLGRFCPDINLIDLPGIRSTSPRGADEEVTISCLRAGSPDLIINLLSASSLERCLVLTLGIMSDYPGIPMICVINMIDELEGAGISLSTASLEKAVGLPFVAISAASGAGLSELKRLISARAEEIAQKPDSRAGQKTHPQALVFPKSNAARAALASRIASAALSRRPSAHRPTDLIDKYLTRPAIGVPAFLLIMALVFWITFGYVGNLLTAFFERTITFPLGRTIELAAAKFGAPPPLRSFLSGCLVGGVGAVVSFLPRITLLFVLLSLLEDSGYMARAAFIADPPLRCAGLSGRAFVPILLGLGCSVTAVMSARTLGDRGERTRCQLFLPMISCSARAPLYPLVAAAFFPRCGWLAVMSVYLVGMVVFLMSVSIARIAAGRALPPMFITELPRYRLPRIRVTLGSAAQRAGDFIKRAGGIIFLSAAAVWLLSYLTPHMRPAGSADESLLALVAGFISPLLSPLGIGNWRAAAALICGIGAKEAIISALGALTGGNPAQTLAASGIFTPASALSFMVFSSLYLPCAATIPAMRAECGSAKLTAAGLAAGFAVAYILSFFVYTAASALMFFG